MADACSGQFVPLYDDSLPLWEKIKTVATKLYGADDIIGDKKVRAQLEEMQASGYGDLPVCMAKTQYSFSTDPTLKGAPTGHVIPVREVRLSAGAGFVVVICGEIMTMPGLPSKPAANSIKLNEEGLVEGLF
jgi:formate--tetrahydrofolate ligase